MSAIDIIILVFLLIGGYTGFKKGLLMEIISLVAFFIAIIFGIKLIDWSIALLSEYISGYDSFLPILAFTIIFIGILLALNLLGKAAKKVLDTTLLGNLDAFAGSLMGIVKWALFISIFLWISESFGMKISFNATQNSILFGPVSSFAPRLFDMFSWLYPYFIDFFQQSKELINSQEIKT